MPTPQKEADPPGHRRERIDGVAGIYLADFTRHDRREGLAAARAVPRAEGPVPRHQEHAAQARVQRAAASPQLDDVPRGADRRWCSARQTRWRRPRSWPTSPRSTSGRASRRRSSDGRLFDDKAISELATLPSREVLLVAAAGHVHRADDAVPGRDRRHAASAGASWRTCWSASRSKACLTRPGARGRTHDVPTRTRRHRKKENDDRCRTAIDQVLDLIGNMTVLELSELKKKYEDKFGVTAAAPDDGDADGRRRRRPRRRSRRRPSSTSCSPAPATRRSRSSRSCAS